MKKNYTISVSARTLWFIIVPLSVLAILTGGLLGIFIIDKFVMPGVVGMDRELMAVPSIVSLPFEDGRQKLYDIGLRAQVLSKEYDELVPEGNIINQKPDAGEKVKKGRPVGVTISKGSEIAMIPDVSRKTEKQANIELRRAGLSVGKIKKDFSDSIPADVVIDVVPNIGTTVSRDLPVEIIVSKGARPTSAEVPNIVGENIAAAKTKIEDSNLALGKIVYKENSTLQPGTIISQSVRPGASIALGAAVDVVVAVSKAPN